MTSSSLRFPARQGSGYAHTSNTPYPFKKPRPGQRGSGMVEFSLIVLPLILSSVGAIELTHWFYVRQAVSSALVTAAKAGSTHHAHPSSIARAFTQGVTSLQAQNWHIQIRSPSAAVFHDFPANIGNTKHHPTIGNSYQREQHQQALEKGWVEGAGPQSGETIFQANTLALRLSYPYNALVPGFSALA
ncbi:MAG: hypothetical protein CML17_01930, partial [Pusillimonas sp.]|nr:hypothetical protein [Pusillimonas sp.]